jgi:exodeoxyribonuclease (lambda-induced)
MSNRHQALEYSEQYTMNHTNEATKAYEATNAQALSNTQRSKEWFKDRYGKFTASEIHKLLGVRGLGETGKTYAIEKAIEQIYGQIEDSYRGADMQRGVELEPLAFAKFQEMHPEATESFMFPYGKHAGASPDGVVGKDAILEIKCPRATKFFKIVADENIDKEYYAQMQMQMLCSNSDKAYFFNYCIVDGEEFHHTIEVKRDEEMIALIKERLEEAIAIKEAYIEKITKNIQK